MLKSLFEKDISPLLKKYGFKKKGLTWNKSTHGLIQVIDFQKSQFGNETENNFTINIGVFYSQVWRKCWGKESPKFIKEEDCFPRIRIGQLLNNFSEEAVDHWWVYNTDTDKKSLSLEVTNLLINKCIPFLDSLLNQRSVVDFYSNYSIRLMPIEKIYLAIIKGNIGDISSSSNLLDEVRAISEAWSNRVEQVIK